MVLNKNKNRDGSKLKVAHVLAGVHDELALDGPHPVLLVLREELVPSNHQSIHVRDTTAGCENTVAILKS